MGVLNDKVLILNKSWIAIRIKNVKHAIKLVSRQRAFIVDTESFAIYSWNEWVKFNVSDNDKYIVSTSGKIKCPEVLVLSSYNKLPKSKPRLTKKNIFIRDGYKCQYSGEKVTKKTADIDHVVPKSKGGKTTWDNLVVCSKKINRLKSNKTIQEVGLELIQKPKEPNFRNVLIDPNMKIPDSWLNFLK